MAKKRAPKAREINSIIVLRTLFKSNPRLRLEFTADMSKLLRGYDIQISDELLGSIVPATTTEIAVGVEDVPPVTLMEKGPPPATPTKRKGLPPATPKKRTVKPPPTPKKRKAAPKKRK